MILFHRRRAREFAIQALYSWQLSNNNINDIELKCLTGQDISNIDLKYFHKLYFGAIKYYKTFEKLIAPYLSRKIKNIGYIERAVLFVALYEMSKLPNIPYKVVINEAIELTKTFGAEESYKFINGVLNSVFSEVFLKTKNKINEALIKKN